MISDAEEACAHPTQDGECAAAWDEVEEVSATLADERLRAKSPEASDPLEKFCQDSPEADECRTYED
eukprot:SM000030S11325  [mRNA]  locus=s30:174445:174645:- [translate_table: standard]